MAEYLIPKYRLEYLQKQLQHIRNKGAQITFEVLDDNVNAPYELNGKRYIMPCVKVEVEGRYIVNGWRFVATIEHSSPENIIRVADTSMENLIPERYWHADRECEHCHIRRERNDTYLVYNEDTDEWKQVGRTCLQGYTNGLNAETCAALSSLTAAVARMSEAIKEGDMSSFTSDRGFAAIPHIDMKEVEKRAYKYVERNGYVSGETGYVFADKLANDDPDVREMATDAEIDAVEVYLAEASEAADASIAGYLRNAYNAWRKENYQRRDAGLITSAVQSYFKDKQRKAAQALRAQQAANINQTAAGNVGDKVEFEIADFKVAYYRSSGTYYGSDYPVYRIVGTDGRIYIWACSNGTELQSGMRLKGTIKRLSEFRGEHQTEVTRCKVLA